MHFISLKLHGGFLIILSAMSLFFSSSAVCMVASKNIRLQDSITNSLPSGKGKVWTLESLLTQGGMLNPRVVAGLASASAAEEQYNAAWQEYLPTPAVNTSTDNNGLNETDISITQPLWTGGRIDGNVEMAAEKAMSDKTAVTATQYDLALSIIAQYQAYAQGLERERVLTSFGERLAFYRVRMNNRVASGASPANDSELLDGRIATNLSQLRSAEEGVEVALNQLSQLTGLSLTRDNLGLSNDNRKPPLLTEVIERAEKYNPKLVRITHDIAAAEAQVKVQRAAVIPTVALVAKHSMVHGSNLNYGDDSSVALQVSLTPGAGLSAFSLTKAAQERVYSLIAERDATQQELLARINGDSEKLNSVINRITQSEINARAASGVLLSYERLFVAGKRSWLDVMNAARELSDADLTVADLQAERIGARYRLDVYAASYGWMKTITEKIPE